MEIQTIEKIKVQLGEIDKLLETFTPEEHQGEYFGQEAEYTAKLLKAGLRATLSHVCALTEAQAEFMRLSTYEERHRIMDVLGEIKGYLDVESYFNVATNLDELKSIIRQYNFRTSSESEEVLRSRINNLQGMCAELGENVEEIRRIGAVAQTTHKSIQVAENSRVAVTELLRDIHERSKEINSLQEKAQNQNEQAAQIAEIVKGYQGTVAAFTKTVAKGENQLASQAAFTEEYVKALAQYRNEREEELEEARTLISEAKAALEYKTAQGISAAYREKYIAARRGRYTWGWLAGSIAFVGFALAVSFGFGWFGTGNTGDSTMLLIMNRFTLVPMMVAGAWFCANQYVKNKNLAEDYSYKAVLAQSMVAFMENLGDKNNPLFIRLLLNQVLQDPLRKTHAEVNFLKEENIGDEGNQGPSQESKNAPPS